MPLAVLICMVIWWRMRFFPYFNALNKHPNVLMFTTQRIVLLIFSGMAFLSPACRKGEEDPSISLVSRKARMSAEWRMKSGTAAFTVSLMHPPAKYNETWTFNGAGFSLNTTESGRPITYVGKYTLNVNIRKNGTFDFNELFMGHPLDCSGTWCFTTGEGKEKNKERAVFTINEVKSGATLNGFFNQMSTTFRFNIIRLAKKELKLRTYGNLALREGDASIAAITEYDLISDED
jgi:hypothetical protein